MIQCQHNDNHKNSKNVSILLPMSLCLILLISESVQMSIYAYICTQAHICERRHHGADLGHAASPGIHRPDGALRPAQRTGHTKSRQQTRPRPRRDTRRDMQMEGPCGNLGEGLCMQGCLGADKIQQIIAAHQCDPDIQWWVVRIFAFENTRLPVACMVRFTGSDQSLM
jgi:hypothetical protein